MCEFVRHDVVGRRIETDLAGLTREQSTVDQPIEDHGTWYAIADHYDVNGLDDTATMRDVVNAAIEIYMLSLNETGIIDFNDMILFPLIKNLAVRFPKDVVMVDEYQDTSRVRQALVRKFVKRGGRLIAVGDRHQAIYGFSGADAEAIPRFERSMSPRIFPLSVTWRCPASIVELARQFVPTYQAAPGASPGSITTVNVLPPDLSPDDAILCRNTAPLISQAYALVRQGIPCKVEGRAIGEGIEALLKRWKVKELDAFERRLDDYQDREYQKAMAKDREDKAQAIEDKCDTARAIVHECRSRGKYTVADAVEFVQNLFGDNLQREKVLTLATYHRAKGREWQRVFLYEHDKRCPSKFAKQAWQIQQENNLAYVAMTRTKDRLCFFYPAPKQAGKEDQP